MTGLRIILPLIALGSLAACGPAFIDKSEPQQVNICYNKATIDPADLLAMASQECAKYGGRAQLKDQTLFYCPAFSPVMMEFACVGGRAPVEGRPTASDYVTKKPTGTPGLTDPVTGPNLYSREFYTPEQGFRR
jgi:hypothetical protein